MKLLWTILKPSLADLGKFLGCVLLTPFIFSTNKVWADTYICPDVNLLQLKMFSTAELKKIDEEALTVLKDIPESDGLQPYTSHLTAEIAYYSGDIDTALHHWWRLLPPTLESEGNNKNSNFTGTALSNFSFWRILQALDNEASPDSESVKKIFYLAEIILDSDFSQDLAGHGKQIKRSLLPTLPQIEEASLLLISRLAWKTGRKEQAQQYFIRYLQKTTSDSFTGTDNQLKDSLVETGLFTQERLQLFNAKRFLAVKSFDKALIELEKLYQITKDPEVKSQAGILLAKYSRGIKTNRQNISILSDITEIAINSDTQFKALSLRARYHGRNKDIPSFISDLELIIDLAPTDNPFAVEAIFRLGKHFLSSDITKGLKYFTQLQEIKSPHNRMDSAYYLPAVSLIRRNQAGDSDAASRMLQMLIGLRPNGPYTTGARFWLARLNEQTGESEKAKNIFETIAQNNPFKYYGIRSRMHLEYGPDAKDMILPESDLIEEFVTQRNQPLEKTNTDFPVDLYSKGILAAIDCGLYQNVLSLDKQLENIWPGQRLESLKLDELDKKGIIPSLAILLSLRLESAASMKLDSSSDRLLTLASRVGKTDDWQLELFLASEIEKMNSGIEISKLSSKYLAASYPNAYLSNIQESTRVNEIPAAFLYAIIRNESRFYRSALSDDDAIGLIQMKPNTFKSLHKKTSPYDCGLSSTAISKKSIYSYLMSENNAITLGGCWIKYELLKPMESNFLHAIMSHNAGTPAVTKWLRSWNEQEENDVELSIELIPYAQTRNFTRHVLTDFIITNQFDAFFKMGTTQND